MGLRAMEDPTLQPLSRHFPETAAELKTNPWRGVASVAKT